MLDLADRSRFPSLPEPWYLTRCRSGVVPRSSSVALVRGNLSCRATPSSMYSSTSVPLRVTRGTICRWALSVMTDSDFPKPHHIGYARDDEARCKRQLS